MKGQVVILRGPSQRAYARQLIDAAVKDAVVTLEDPRRTLPQNRLFWQMLGDVSRAGPEGRHHTPDVWRALFLHACGHAVQFEVGLNNLPFPVGFRSSKLTKEQMADLITFIRQYGDEHGVKWTDEMEVHNCE